MLFAFQNPFWNFGENLMLMLFIYHVFCLSIPFWNLGENLMLMLYSYPLGGRGEICNNFLHRLGSSFQLCNFVLCQNIYFFLFDFLALEMLALGNIISEAKKLEPFTILQLQDDSRHTFSYIFFSYTFPDESYRILFLYLPRFPCHFYHVVIGTQQGISLWYSDFLGVSWWINECLSNGIFSLTCYS